MPCRTVLCCAVLCRAGPCCAAWCDPSCSECLLVSAELIADQPASTSGVKRKRNAGKGRGCWKQPWQISSLYLDTEALLTALQTGWFLPLYLVHTKQLTKFASMHAVCCLCSCKILESTVQIAVVVSLLHSSMSRQEHLCCFLRPPCSMSL